ncbi:MAG: hypothetical protein QG642_592, partial [Patescibacteria group bacterium]|nr:hypothetical protein [Patescibacteria group bacterium]
MSGYKKLVFITIAIMFATSVVLAARPAQAGWPTTVLADIPGAVKWVYEKAKYAVEKAQGALTTQLVNQTLSTFMNKLAYDLANNIAVGGPGRTPLFEQQGFTESIQTAKDAALGEFIGQLSQNSFADLGFNLCDPSLSVKLSLTLSLVDSRAPARPTCDWRKVQNEWAKFGDNFTADLIKLQLDTRGGSKNLDDFFATGFSMEQTDLGVFAKLSEAARQKELDAAKAKEALTQKCQGYLDVKEPITEDIKTSCSDVLNMKDAVIKATSEIETQKITESGLKKEVGIIGQIMKTAGNIFVNTFTSKLMNRWIKEGTCSLLGGGCTNWLKSTTNTALRDSLLAQLRGGVDVSKSSSGFVLDFQKIEPDILESYNIFEEYAVCPEDVEFRTPDNCVVS